MLPKRLHASQNKAGMGRLLPSGLLLQSPTHSQQQHTCLTLVQSRGVNGAEEGSNQTARAHARTMARRPLMTSGAGPLNLNASHSLTWNFLLLAAACVGWGCGGARRGVAFTQPHTAQVLVACPAPRVICAGSQQCSCRGDGSGVRGTCVCMHACKHASAPPL